jgi:hypothetical protein
MIGGEEEMRPGIQAHVGRYIVEGPYTDLHHRMEIYFHSAQVYGKHNSGIVPVGSSPVLEVRPNIME